MRYEYGKTKKTKRHPAMEVEPRSPEDFEIRIGLLENRVEDLERVLKHTSRELAQTRVDAQIRDTTIDEMGKTVRRLDLMVGQLLAKGAIK